MDFDTLFQQIVDENSFTFEPKNIHRDDYGIVQNKRRIEDAKSNIEDLIRGTITYYKQFDNIEPSNNGAVEELEGFSKYLTKQLNPYRNFR